MAKAAHGKALMSKLRGDPKVRDAEKLGGWIKKHKKSSKIKGAAKKGRKAAASKGKKDGGKTSVPHVPPQTDPDTVKTDALSNEQRRERAKKFKEGDTVLGRPRIKNRLSGNWKVADEPVEGKIKKKFDNGLIGVYHTDLPGDRYKIYDPKDLRKK